MNKPFTGNAENHIHVFMASPQIEDTTFPIVTVHLRNDSSDDRFIGDLRLLAGIPTWT